jgi:hypothetical protein
LYVHDRYNAIQTISYIHINIYRACFQKVGLLKETKVWGEEKKNDRNW